MIVCASSQSPGPNSSRVRSRLRSPDTPVIWTVTAVVAAVANATVYVAVSPSGTVTADALNTRPGSFSRTVTTSSAPSPRYSTAPDARCVSVTSASWVLSSSSATVTVTSCRTCQSASVNTRPILSRLRSPDTPPIRTVTSAVGRVCSATV